MSVAGRHTLRKGGRHMNIRGVNGMPSSDVHYNTRSMQTHESDVSKSAKAEPIRDTVEIRYQEPKPAVNAETQEQGETSLLPRLKQHWEQFKAKMARFLLEKGVLKVDEVNPERLQFNPYFIEEKKQDFQNWAFFQKVKYKVQAISQSFVRWFSELMGGNYFAKKEEPKEELTEKEHFSEEETEPQKTTKDENHLMASYNRKGEYTHLTTKK